MSETTPPTTAGPPGSCPGGRYNDFRALLLAAADGNAQAVADLVDGYGPRLLPVIRAGLPRRMRKLFDSQDFLQAVWATFFLNEDPSRFESPGHLAAFLRGIAVNKLRYQVHQRFAVQKNRLDREVAIADVSESRARPGAAKETPSQLAIARECMERLLDGQPEHYRKIIEMKAAGMSAAEIAAHVGRNEGSVRRVLARLGERLGR